MASNLAGRILVTGADGFIGSHLVERLIASGVQVRAFVFYNSWNSIGWLAELPLETRRSVEIFAGDIRDEARVAQAVEGCDYVFHLASLVAIPHSYEAPRAYIDTNVIGTLNVLQACRRAERLARLVHTSTSEVYGTAQRVPIDESHPLAGQSPYSASKIGADALAESFHRSYRLPVVTARPFNTFGPRQTARAVIPTIASQLLSGAKELRLGALTPTRDFNYITDTVAGLIALAQCAKAEGRVVNIGSGEEWSIKTTAEMLMDICGRAVPIVHENVRDRPENSEVNRLCANNQAIRALTDWSPAIKFRDGLTRTCEWIGKNIHHFEPTRYLV
jgi:NAD dependent epimerase/dehydratase